jgi:hypothetical protein
MQTVVAPSGKFKSPRKISCWQADFQGIVPLFSAIRHCRDERYLEFLHTFMILSSILHQDQRQQTIKKFLHPPEKSLQFRIMGPSVCDTAGS